MLNFYKILINNKLGSVKMLAQGNRALEILVGTTCLSLHSTDASGTNRSWDNSSPAPSGSFQAENPGKAEKLPNVALPEMVKFENGPHFFTNSSNLADLCQAREEFSRIEIFLRESCRWVANPPGMRSP
jgi:hypothetical protein